LGTQKGLFTPFLSISIISLYAKHKANLPPISPFLILIYNLHLQGFMSQKITLTVMTENMPSIVVVEIQVASVCLFVEWQALT